MNNDLLKNMMFMNSNNPVLNMILLNVSDFLMKYTEKIITSLIEKYTNKIENSIQTLNTITDPTTLTLERFYKEKNETADADAILYYISNLPNIKALFVNFTDYIINYKEEFEITPKIKCKLLKTIIGTNHTLEYIRLKLYSEELNMKEIREFVDNSVKDYVRQNTNKIGSKKYFFDQITQKFSNENTIFAKHLFTTNRTFENVFFDNDEQLKNRVELFINNKEWYDKRGLPHTLGLLLQGAPGTGKSSTIKAIAKYTNRHIININTSQIKTKTQLKELFYNETVHVRKGVSGETFIIPLNERIYVFEDVDCMGDVVFSRTKKNKEHEKIKEKERYEENKRIEEMKKLNPNMKVDLPIDDNIDLSTMLNILDGTLELPGRIVIFTTNHPEVLDPALIRPGRIDMIIKFQNTSKKIFKKLYELYYNKLCSDEELELFPENKWSPSYICQFLFKNITTPELLMEDIINTEINKEPTIDINDELKDNKEIEVIQNDELKDNKEIEVMQNDKLKDNKEIEVMQNDKLKDNKEIEVMQNDELKDNKEIEVMQTQTNIFNIPYKEIILPQYTDKFIIKHLTQIPSTSNELKLDFNSISFSMDKSGLKMSEDVKSFFYKRLDELQNNEALTDCIYKKNITLITPTNEIQQTPNILNPTINKNKLENFF